MEDKGAEHDLSPLVMASANNFMVRAEDALQERFVGSIRMSVE